MFKSIIIGAGEIGKSLHKVIGGDISDVTILTERYDIIHICFPYSNSFVKEVKRYQELFFPKYTVIHSTVPVGTSRECDAIHSPVIGVHPYLEESLKTFTKFIGGEDASEVADFFRRSGMKVYITDKPETTELMKLLCTTKYGVDIEFAKEAKEQCNKYEVPFEAYTLWNNNYNYGYTKLSQEQYVRPNLTPIKGKIGGHCVVQNCHLLTSKFTKFIINLNTRNIK